MIRRLTGTVLLVVMTLGAILQSVAAYDVDSLSVIPSETECPGGAATVTAFVSGDPPDGTLVHFLTDPPGLVSPGTGETVAGYAAATITPDAHYDDGIDVFAFTDGGVWVGAILECTQGGSIAGRITDHIGQPVEGARVDAWSTTCCKFDQGVATTASDGTYEITGLFPANYEVFARGEGNLPTYHPEPVFVSRDSITRSIDIEMQPGGTISGRVTHAGLGLANAAVFIPALFYGGQTDAQGYYSLTGVPPGDHVVLAGVFGSGYATEYYSDAYTSSWATPVTVVGGATTQNINFDLAIGGSITGRVTDPFGAGVPNASVTAVGPAFAQWTMSDNAGFYTVNGLSPGLHTVSAEDALASYPVTYFHDKFNNQSADPVDVALGLTTTSIDIDLGRFGLIAGTITGIVYPYTHVNAEPSSCCGDSFGTNPNQDGSYTIEHVIPGCYKIRVDSWSAPTMFFDAKFHFANADVVCVDPAEEVTGINFDLVPRDNDDIDLAFGVFTFPYIDIHDNAGATLEPGEPQPCGNIGATRWFRFTIPEAAGVAPTVNVVTLGSSFDTAVAAYSGDPLWSPPGGLAAIACADTPGGQETLSFTGAQDQTYYVQAGGASGAAGLLSLAITCGPQGNDADCDGIASSPDNCPVAHNPMQDDLDADGQGDACDNDLDGDGIPNFDEETFNTEERTPDTDGDGCSDGAEALGSEPEFGGLRDPLNYWDFYDVDANTNIDLGDTLAILARFGSLPGDTLYDERFDRYLPDGHPGHRSAQAAGSEIGIDLGDALVNLRSFGHLCA